MNENYTMQRGYNRYQAKWCHYHESATHNTSKCSYLKKLKENDKKTIRYINYQGNQGEYKHIANDVTEDGKKDELNKNSYLYSVDYTNCKFFKTQIWYKNTILSALIDTGSEINIINKKYVDDCDIEKSQVRLTTANRNVMDSCGIIKIIK
ncbi:hypothetical protein BDAP_000410 [Binucleata daphniae]